MAAVSAGDQERAEAGLRPVRVPSLECASQGTLRSRRQRHGAGPIPAAPDAAGAHEGDGFHNHQ